jgi:plastocyanin
MKKFGLTVAVSLGACVLMVAMTKASGVRKVDVEDRCDPASFNAAIGDGTCVGDGDVTFAEFLEFLNPVDFGHEKWRFNFGRGRVDAGESLRAVNRGGEFHTFTEVEEYGGGCIPDLNGPLGLTPVAECDAVTEVAPGVFVPTAFLTTGIDAGASRDFTVEGKGNHKFQCLIHPWMRQDVKVRD